MFKNVAIKGILIGFISYFVLSIVLVLIGVENFIIRAIIIAIILVVGLFIFKIQKTKISE